jgi:hypothetical protein
MRFSLASFSFVVVALGAASATVGIGCTSILGDFSSVGSADSGVDGMPGLDAAMNPEEGLRDGAADVASDGAADTSSDAPADVDAAAWSPTTLDMQGKLALWLEASSANVVVSSGLIGAWNDSSSNANNATNVSGGPQVETAAVNGHDSVHFNARGVTLTIADATSLQFATDQFAIVAVTRASTGSGYYFSKVSTTASGGGNLYASGLEFLVENEADDAGAQVVYPVAHVDSSSGNEADWTGPGLEDNNYHVVVLRRTNPFALTLTIDSQPTQSTAISQFSISQPGEDVNIGGVIYGSFHAAVDLSIAEMLIVHSSTGVVADADVASVKAYLKSKYAL